MKKAKDRSKGTRVAVLKSVETPFDSTDFMTFQKAMWLHPDGVITEGYRFMRRTPKGLRADRGQARLQPGMMDVLFALARAAGWYPG